MIDGRVQARTSSGSRRQDPGIRLGRLSLVFALLFAVPAHVQAQDALPEPWDLTDFNLELNDAFNDDLEDICRCRDVEGATRFETLLEELEAMERSLAPEALREALRDEGLDIPVESGDTPRSYLGRAWGRARWTDVGRHEPLLDRLQDLARMAENVEIVRRNRMNRFSGESEAPPDVDREREILRTLRRLFADCRGDESIPPPPDEDGFDISAGLVIDAPDLQPEGPPPTAAEIREALRNEVKNLCCRAHEIEGGYGAWFWPASVGIAGSDPDVQEEEREYKQLLHDLYLTMETRGFHDWVQDSEELFRDGLVRKRCTDETMRSIDVGLVIRDDQPRRVSSVIDPPEGPPVPSIADRREADPPRDDEPGREVGDPPDDEPERRGPPPGFRHVTVGADPSRHTPESNHVAEGPNASARVRDFFEEGREVPHVEDGEFTDRHLTRGEHESQFVPPERHVAEGPDASSLKDAPPTPPEGQRHLTRGPGDSSFVPEDRHVSEGPDASGLERGGGPEDGDEDEEDEKDEEEDEEEETEDDDSGGELARNPEDHNPDEIDDAPPARGVQRMIVDIDKVRTHVGQEGPGGWAPYRDSGGAAPDVYLVSLGTSTGRTFLVHAVGESADLGGVVVAEPVAVPARERRRIEERLRSEGASGAPTDGYCLEYERLVPPPGTLYRLASRTVQEEHAPVRRILAAARRLMDAGALSPDTEAERYFHTIRQWAIWTREQGFDERGFAEAFVERARKNFRAAGQAWDDQVETAVRSVVPNRWRDVQAVLSEAGE